MRSAWILVLTLGCQSPVIDGGGCSTVESWDRAADFTGPVTHSMELDDGTRSEPVELIWAHDENWLFAFDPRGMGGGLRLVFAVSSRFEVEERASAPCGLLADFAPERAPTLRSHMRVDWGQERAAVGPREPLGGDIESLVFSVPDDEDVRARLPIREHDADGRLVRLIAHTNYLVVGVADPVWVRHELMRVE